MQSMFYTIYQTTNLINNKIYIGKHITSDLNDGYIGSGKYLKRAIAKYGIENFRKDILFVFDNEAAMNVKEAELVTADFVLQETNYNLCVGGQGGFSYINREIWNPNSRKEHNSRISGLLEENGFDRTKYDYDSYLVIARQVRSVLFKEGKIDIGHLTFKGNKHSAKTKEQMSGPRPNSCGEKNSQFGTCWITDGTKNRKISRSEPLPEGWYLGRK